MRPAPPLSQSRAVTAKIAALIILCVGVGVTLLSARQRRLVAAHDVAVQHARAQQDERAILRLKQEIAQRVSLPRIRAAAIQEGVVEQVIAPRESTRIRAQTATGRTAIAGERRTAFE